MALNKDWMKIKNRSLRDYVLGVDAFLDFAFSNLSNDGSDAMSIRCPCDKCRNLFHKGRPEVRFHLLKWGMYENYTTWDFHGESVHHNSDGNMNESAEGGDEYDYDDINMLADACGVAGMNLELENDIDIEDNIGEEPTGEAAKFYRLLKEYQQPLTTNGTKMSRLSYIIRLLHLKVLHNWSDSSFDSLLKLQLQAWGTSLPDSYYEAKKLIAELGLECVKIDACANDCILYWREYADLNECPTCGLSRWKKAEKGPSKGKDVPCKVLRYFPLKSRLQRLYMSRKTAKDMRWHKEERVEDGVMRHPADSVAWKSLDEEYSWFAEDARNVRLGLACDGFQPFTNSQHSIWPVVLIPYNLPPWLCMKPHSFMLTLLIPGPTSPGRNIDVYLQPLIEELKELWETGIETYDAHSRQNFVMHAGVLWTINDFPAYGDLSGWSTKGRFACPSCHKETRRTSLKNKGGYLGHRRWLPLNHRWRKDAKSFDNTKEKGVAPEPLSGDDVLEECSKFTPSKFGKATGGKRKRDGSNCLYGWNKRSIFFELPYWRKLKIRHNLDVMHIEKNVSQNILATIMQIKGKTKDTAKARIDLMNMGIRDELHLVVDGDEVLVPMACYTLDPTAKDALCKMFATIKSPDGYLSNISRCVKDNGKKISCLKSHDHHVFIEQLLPFAIRDFLPKHVYEPLIELSMFFRNLCAKNITLEELDALERQIPYTLCKLEMIFPPAFFDVMVHLVVHLAAEAKIAGPVRYRWMYPVERYLRTLKAYIRNRAYPEGSLAEGYLADECLTFCSRYMSDIDTKFNRKGRNDDISNEGRSESNLEIFNSIGYPGGQGVPENLSLDDWNEIHYYILHNCDELLDFVSEHKAELQRESSRNLEERHRAGFATWIEQQINRLHKDGHVDGDVYNLVCRPSRIARRYEAYTVNGFRFHTENRSGDRKTQSCGVLVKGDDSSDKEYYGVVKDIYEVHYPGQNNVYVFKCDWFDVQHHGRGYKVDEYGLISVNKTRRLKTKEVFVLESQVQQVFYIQDPRNDDWQFVVKTQPRDLYCMPDKDVEEEEVLDDAYQQEEAEVDVQGNISTLVNDDYSVSYLATGHVMKEREPGVVKMVKKAIEEIGDKYDNDFIDDGDIQEYGSSEEEGEFFDSASENDE